MNRLKNWPRVAAFDLDSTLIPCEFVDELAARRGLLEKTRELTRAAVSGGMSFRESFLRRLEILAGTPVEVAEELISQTPLAPGAVETIEKLRENGCRTAIITGGYARLGRAIQRRLGIDALYATELEEAAGVLTGRLAGPLMDDKAAALRHFCALQNVPPEHSMAVGDGATDLSMLAAAGIGIVHTPGQPLTEIISIFLVAPLLER